MGMDHYTYFHTRNDTNAVFYVGKGKGARAHQHGRNAHWGSVVAKYGYSVHIAATWDTEAEAFEHEKFLILCLKDMGMPITNMTPGGDGGNTTGGRVWMHCGEDRLMVNRVDIDQLIAKGWVIGSGVPGRKDIGLLYRGIPKSAESRAKISKTLSGRKLPAEHAKAIGLAQLGLKRTNEAKKNISNALIGKIKSAEHCLNLSKSKQGKAVANNGLIEKRVTVGELEVLIIDGWTQGLLKGSCPVCGQVGGRSHMTRFHFNNCRHI